MRSISSILLAAQTTVRRNMNYIFLIIADCLLNNLHLVVALDAEIWLYGLSTTQGCLSIDYKQHILSLTREKYVIH
jgi:hypothetical protein